MTDLHGHLGFQNVPAGTMSKETYTRENLIDHLQRLPITASAPWSESVIWSIMLTDAAVAPSGAMFLCGCATR